MIFPIIPSIFIKFFLHLQRNALALTEVIASDNFSELWGNS